MSIYKPDWREAKQRMRDWWVGEKVDRVIAKITAPIPPQTELRSTKFVSDVPGKYIDPEIVFNNLDYGLERTFWGGEAFPFHFVYLGPMFSLAWLGCKPNFMPDTTWYAPCYKNLDDLSENFNFDSNNEWWQLQKKIISLSAQRSKGRYLTTQGGISSIIDIIAGLIGEENLLIAMMEEPEKLKAIRDKIAKLGVTTFEETCKATNAKTLGYIDWMGVWSDKKLRTNQCDICVMFSPEMFRDFVLEDLESTYECLERGIYHLDGEEQIRHLDVLLKIDKLKVIQWVPSFRMNQPEYRDPLNWLELFKRIQNSGKSVIITTPPERVSELLGKIDRRKTILNIGCPDAETANKVLSSLDKIGT
ncbi:MAG: hypothetical protein WCS27_12945 [Victivallaceae bacterium]